MGLFTTLIISGLLAGLYSAVWGTIKDTKYEKFSTRSFIRSPILGILFGVVVFIFLKLQPQIEIYSPIIYFLLCAALERSSTEIYKEFFRQEDQSKYRIHQRFGIWGKPIENRVVRATLGTIFFIMLYAFSYLWRDVIINIGANKYIGAIMAASVGGILGSVGGANKDAPKEGFKRLLLFRSWFVAVISGLLLVDLTNDYIIIGFSATGLERTVTEFYKTFLMGKKPGKFH